jgi:hypothetical protein
MQAKHSRALLLPVAALFLVPGFSQELTLFQDDSPRGGFTQGGPPQATRAPAIPEVVLKGIYRLGDMYHLSLQSGEGGAVHKVTWQPSQSSAPVFNGYQIQVVDSRNVTLVLPPGLSCQTSAQSGGTCLGRNQMSLSFTQTDPTPARRPPNQGNNNNPSGGNNDRPPGQRNDNGSWNAQPGDGADLPALLEAARNDPSGADREAIEAAIRGRIGGRGNSAGNTGGRGGRGNFNGGANGGGLGSNNTGGGRGGNGQ